MGIRDKGVALADRFRGEAQPHRLLDVLWTRLAGASRRQPVDFARLERRRLRNDALACPLAHCPRARPDFDPPTYPLSPERLRGIVAAVAREEEGAEPLSGPSAAGQDRYVVRSRVLRFPDLVDVRAIPMAGDRSTIALYSRSVVGLGDFGVNRRRVRRWLAQIEALARQHGASEPSGP